METIKGIVKVSTDPKEFQGEMQIGFILKENPDKWYNILGNEESLKETKGKLLKKGNEIEFNMDENKNILDLKVITETKEEDWEEDIVNFETLLTAAHEKSKGEFSIKTKMLEVDIEKKYALFKASVIIREGKVGEVELPEVVFEGHGDATAENVTGDFIKPHFIRLAETRSICRALRWYTNNAKCADEEKNDKNL